MILSVRVRVRVRLSEYGYGTGFCTVRVRVRQLLKCLVWLCLVIEKLAFGAFRIPKFPKSARFAREGQRQCCFGNVMEISGQKFIKVYSRFTRLCYGLGPERETAGQWPKLDEILLNNRTISK